MRTALLVLLAGCKAASPGLPSEGVPSKGAPSEGSTGYVLVVDGKTIGPSTLVRGPDGVTASYTRQDGTRGRAELALDARGLLVRYRQTEVGESFAVGQGMARWSNPAERGAEAGARPAFYVPFDDNPFNAGLLARALLDAPGHRLPLLPSGEAALASLAAVTLPGGRAVA